MAVKGTYNCVLHTPMGRQEGTLKIVPAKGGGSFSGTLTNPLMGEIEIENGTIEGDSIFAEMRIAKPMRMDVSCKATVDGDQLSGSVKAGMFGSMKLSGQRR